MNTGPRCLAVVSGRPGPSYDRFMTIQFNRMLASVKAHLLFNINEYLKIYLNARFRVLGSIQYSTAVFGGSRLPHYAFIRTQVAIRKVDTTSGLQFLRAMLAPGGRPRSGVRDPAGLRGATSDAHRRDRRIDILRLKSSKARGSHAAGKKADAPFTIPMPGTSSRKRDVRPRTRGFEDESKPREARQGHCREREPSAYRRFSQTPCQARAGIASARRIRRK